VKLMLYTCTEVRIPRSCQLDSMGSLSLRAPEVSHWFPRCGRRQSRDDYLALGGIVVHAAFHMLIYRNSSIRIDACVRLNNSELFVEGTWT
jgi:hypothetical protein